MRFISYLNKCCCSKIVKQQQQNQSNNTDEEDDELRIVDITPSVPWTAGQSGVITFNQNITLIGNDYGNVTLLSQNNEPYTIQFPGLMFGYKNNSMTIHQIYDDTSGGSHQMTGCDCYEVTTSDNKMYITYLDTNVRFYFNGINIQKIPKFSIQPELPWNEESLDYYQNAGYIYSNLSFYPNEEDMNIKDLIINNSIKFFRNGQQLYVYSFGNDIYIYDVDLSDESLIENATQEWWDEHSIGTIYYDPSYNYLVEVYLYKSIDRIEFPE